MTACLTLIGHMRMETQPRGQTGRSNVSKGERLTRETLTRSVARGHTSRRHSTRDRTPRARAPDCGSGTNASGPSEQTDERTT